MKLLLLAFGKPILAAAGFGFASLAPSHHHFEHELGAEGGAVLGAAIGGDIGELEVVPKVEADILVLPVPAEPPAKKEEEDQEDE